MVPVQRVNYSWAGFLNFFSSVVIIFVFLLIYFSPSYSRLPVSLYSKLIMWYRRFGWNGHRLSAKRWHGYQCVRGYSFWLLENYFISVARGNTWWSSFHVIIWGQAVELEGFRRVLPVEESKSNDEWKF